MRLLVIAFLGLVSSFSGVAQSVSLDTFASTFQKENKVNEIRLLKKVLAQAHKVYLKNYKAYASLDETLTTGNFDCLSGTILLSNVLNKLGFRYKIFETNYHIFLMVETSKGNVIVESTDKNHGLITDRQEIEERLAKYKSFGKGTPMYLSQIEIFNELNPSNLSGLVLFNHSIVNFLNEKFESSIDLLDRAKKIYNSPRVSELAKVMLHQVSLSGNLDEETKTNLIIRLKSLIDERISFASRGN